MTVIMTMWIKFWFDKLNFSKCLIGYVVASEKVNVLGASPFN